MKELYNIERRLQSKAQNSEVDVDTEALWSAIEPTLPTKKRKILPLWILGAFIIGITAMGLGRLVSNSTGENVITPATSVLGTDISVSEEKSEVGKELKSIEEISNSLNSTVLSIVEDPKESSPLSRLKLIEDEILYIRKEENRQKGNTSLSDDWIDDNGLSNNVSIGGVPADAALTPVLLGDDGTSIPAIELRSKLDIKSQEFKYSNPSHLSLSKLGLDQLNVLSISSLVTGYMLPYSPPYRHSIFYSNDDFRWKFNLTLGYSNSSTVLGVRDIDFKDHLASRSEAESSLSSWHIRGNASFHLNSDWALKTGLKFSQLYGQSSSIISKSERVLLEDVVIERVVGPDGIDEIRGAVEVLQETVSEVNRINRTQYLDVELLIMRRVDFEVVDVSVGAGLSYGLAYNRTGYIHPSNAEEYDLSLDDNDWFKRASGLGGLLELGIQYPLSDYLDLEMYGQYNYPISNISTNTYGLSERSIRYHIGIGVGFKL